VRTIAVIAAALLILLPFGAEAKRTRERHKQKHAAQHVKSERTVSHGAIRKISHLTGIGSGHEEALAVYHKCMNAEDVLGKAVLFLRNDRISNEVPLGNSERLGHELCVIDVLQLKRYLTLHEVVQALPADLVPINHPWIGLSPGLPEERAVANPWVRDYLENLALLLHQELVQVSESFDKSFVVSSLVRPVAIQRVQWNSPARCVNESSLCSSHTTGSTFDITRKYLTTEQEKILLKQLQQDRKKGKILFILEPKGNHYHIFVFPPELATMIGPLQA
jgi:hypothetical protein